MQISMATLTTLTVALLGIAAAARYDGDITKWNSTAKHNTTTTTNSTRPLVTNQPSKPHTFQLRAIVQGLANTTKLSTGSPVWVGSPKTDGKFGLYTDPFYGNVPNGTVPGEFRFTDEKLVLKQNVKLRGNIIYEDPKSGYLNKTYAIAPSNRTLPLEHALMIRVPLFALFDTSLPSTVPTEFFVDMKNDLGFGRVSSVLNAPFWLCRVEYNGKAVGVLSFPPAYNLTHGQELTSIDCLKDVELRVYLTL